MFFKRRSRANSYIEADAPQRSQSYDDYEKQRPDSSHTLPTHLQHQPQQQLQQQLQQPQQQVLTAEDQDMYPRPQQPQETQFARTLSNGTALGQPSPSMNSAMKAEPMPDLLAQAFNQAVRPYTEKIEQLESQLADMQSWVEQLEQQRAEVHSWIDKRGLRPGTPFCLPIALPVYVY